MSLAKEPYNLENVKELTKKFKAFLEMLAKEKKYTYPEILVAFESAYVGRLFEKMKGVKID